MFLILLQGHTLINMKTLKKRVKDLIIQYFLSYGCDNLCRKLSQLGVCRGDTLMVHSSWLPNSGFKGRPAEMISALKEVVGDDGLLSMTSMTYQNESSAGFLARKVPLNARRSASKMGLLTEVFRRGKGVKRSLNPSHPILAWGAKADCFVSGHDEIDKSFGVGSPFDKLLQSNGKILCIDAPFSTITFTHFLEDRIAATLPFNLYEPAPMTGVVIDYSGNEITVPTYVLSQQANALRREQRLIDELDRLNLIKRSKIGNTRLLLIDCKAMTDCVDQMIVDGKSFFDA